jgi:hypothetical protein
LMHWVADMSLMELRRLSKLSEKSTKYYVNDYKKECSIDGCQGKNFALIAYKLPSIRKQVYLCLQHFDLCIKDPVRFFETHLTKKDWKEHIHWEQLDYWDKKMPKTEGIWIDPKDYE